MTSDRARHRRLFGLPWRTSARIRDDFEDELAFHHEMLVRELMERGIPASEARALASRECGDVDDARAYVRALDRATERTHRRRSAVQAMRQEAVHAIRRLCRAPGFTAVQIATLALGIAACALMVNIVSAALLTPLPYKNPDRVAMI
ncbi:MAG: permease prefix domain 1-containing protein [Gemmatimonadaceae bacterium]